MKTEKTIHIGIVGAGIIGSTIYQLLISCGKKYQITIADQKDLGKYADHVTTNKGLMGGPNKVLHNRLTGDVFVRYVTEAP